MTEKTNDDADAGRWRGPLFEGFRSPLWWKDKHYRRLEPPKSVTFPICNACSRVVWEWPHFEEEVPDNAVCGPCFKEAQEEDR